MAPTYLFLILFLFCIVCSVNNVFPVLWGLKGTILNFGPLPVFIVFCLRRFVFIPLIMFLFVFNVFLRALKGGPLDGRKKWFCNCTNVTFRPLLVVFFFCLRRFLFLLFTYICFHVFWRLREGDPWMEEKTDFVTAQMSLFGAVFSASGTCDKKKP